MEATAEIGGYEYDGGGLNRSHGALLPALINLLHKENPAHNWRLFDLGCGNGSIARELSRFGFKVIGVDPSIKGIAHANARNPELRLEIGSAYDDLAGKYGSFNAVVSLEVVEHVYSPRKYAKWPAPGSDDTRLS